MIRPLPFRTPQPDEPWVVHCTKCLSDKGAYAPRPKDAWRDGGTWRDGTAWAIFLRTAPCKHCHGHTFTCVYQGAIDAYDRP